MPKGKSKSKDICPICLSKVRNEKSTSACNHRFCQACLSEWIKTQNTCPVCKRRFNRMVQPGTTTRDDKPGALDEKPRKGKKQTLIKDRNQQQQEQQQIFSVLQGRNTRGHEIKLLNLFCMLQDIAKE